MRLIFFVLVFATYLEGAGSKQIEFEDLYSFPFNATNLSEPIRLRNGDFFISSRHDGTGLSDENNLFLFSSRGTLQRSIVAKGTGWKPLLLSTGNLFWPFREKGILISPLGTVIDEMETPTHRNEEVIPLAPGRFAWLQPNSKTGETQLTILDDDGNTVGAIALPLGAGLSNGIEVFSNGNILAGFHRGDIPTGKLDVYSPEGTLLAEVPTPGNTCLPIGTAQKGEVINVVCDNGMIEQISSAGRVKNRIKIPGYLDFNTVFRRDGVAVIPGRACKYMGKDCQVKSSYVVLDMESLDYDVISLPGKVIVTRPFRFSDGTVAIGLSDRKLTRANLVFFDRLGQQLKDHPIVSFYEGSAYLKGDLSMSQDRCFLGEIRYSPNRTRWSFFDNHGNLVLRSEYQDGYLDMKGLVPLADGRVAASISSGNIGFARLLGFRLP